MLLSSAARLSVSVMPSRNCSSSRHVDVNGLAEALNAKYDRSEASELEARMDRNDAAVERMEDVQENRWRRARADPRSSRPGRALPSLPRRGWRHPLSARAPWRARRRVRASFEERADGQDAAIGKLRDGLRELDGEIRDIREENELQQMHIDEIYGLVESGTVTEVEYGTLVSLRDRGSLRPGSLYSTRR